MLCYNISIRDLKAKCYVITYALKAFKLNIESIILTIWQLHHLNLNIPLPLSLNRTHPCN
jgi:hypothetical protein